jgi:hypothetical protein
MARKKWAPRHSFTEREIRFLEENAAGRLRAELTWMFNLFFQLDLTVNQVGQFCWRNRLPGLDTRFKKGVVSNPAQSIKRGERRSPETEFRPGKKLNNAAAVGDEVVDTGGYTRVKVRSRSPLPRRHWKLKHHLVWEAANGRKVPKSHAVIFADGDKGNLDPGNLLCVSRAELAVMNRWHLAGPSGDLARAGKAVADLKIAIRDAQTGRKRKTKKK